MPKSAEVTISIPEDRVIHVDYMDLLSAFRIARDTAERERFRGVKERYDNAIRAMGEDKDRDGTTKAARSSSSSRLII